jgi:hypothetical protein
VFDNNPARTQCSILRPRTHFVRIDIQFKIGFGAPSSPDVFGKGFIVPGDRRLGWAISRTFTAVAIVVRGRLDDASWGFDRRFRADGLCYSDDDPATHNFGIYLLMVVMFFIAELQF